MRSIWPDNVANMPERVPASLMGSPNGEHSPAPRSAASRRRRPLAAGRTASSASWSEILEGLAVSCRATAYSPPGSLGGRLATIARRQPRPTGLRVRAGGPSRRGLQIFRRVARCYTIGLGLHLRVGAVRGRVPGLVVSGHRTSKCRASCASSPCLARKQSQRERDERDPRDHDDCVHDHIVDCAGTASVIAGGSAYGDRDLIAGSQRFGRIACRWTDVL